MKKEELIKYCKNDKRICPNPTEWMKIGKILKIKVGGHPCTPLILNGWAFSSDLEKRNRLTDQIEYASNDPEIYEELKDYILSLTDDQWHKE